ncbi:MAG: hypothetical protein WCS99_17290, partial [Limisphaerales bacterium]
MPSTLTGLRFDYGAIPDVFAAVFHSLADTDRSIVTFPADGSATVNLRFDADTPALTIRSERNTRGTLRLTPKSQIKLLVRVPARAPRDSLRPAVDGKPLPLRREGSFVVIEKTEATAGSTISLSHDLRERDTVEELPVSHKQCHPHW